MEKVKCRATGKLGLFSTASEAGKWEERPEGMRVLK
jgi:hypothetical protein